jgi:hypothetical protein
MTRMMKTPVLRSPSRSETCTSTSSYIFCVGIFTSGHSVMQTLGPLLENLATGLRRTTGLVLYTLVAGHVRAGDVETIRVLGYVTMFPLSLPRI